MPGEKSLGEQQGLARGPDAPSAKIVVKSSGAASRQPERPRALAKLFADRGGKLELARPYSRVGLTIVDVVSGRLDDPDYARRPVGTNHLDVVLLDEAAFVASTGADDFSGTWTLTRTADGTLVASSIQDTPWPAERVARREPRIAETKQLLHAATPEERIRGLDMFEKHLFYELVPDILELLDDDRSTQQQVPPGKGRGARNVRAVALEMLVRMMNGFGDDRMPLDGDRAKWTAFVKALALPDTAVRRQTASTLMGMATIPMPQSWPELAAIDGGFVMSIDRMEQPFDQHREGLAVTRMPFTARTWISSQSGEALDPVKGPDGSLALLHTSNARWNLAITSPAGATKILDLSLPSATSHAAIAASAKGYVVAFIKGETEELVNLARFDLAGKPAGSPVQVALPSTAQGGYHHGVFPLAIAARPGGWFVVAEASTGTMLLTLDDNFKQVGAPLAVASPTIGIAQVKFAVGKERALLVWVHQERLGVAKLGYLVVDLAGALVSHRQFAGYDVDRAARPVVLDDGGFAVAWIANEQELHVGRWNAQGKLAGTAFLQARGASSLVLALARDGKELIVGYEDVANYPYTLMARRLDPATIQ